MQKGHVLEFKCLKCKHPVQFSVFDLESRDPIINCTSCQKKYALSDDVLKRQLRKFESLCLQLVESEEILGETSVGIDVGERHIQIPFKLLLTRLNTTLNLKMGNENVVITFRMEPLRDVPPEVIPK